MKLGDLKTTLMKLGTGFKPAGDIKDAADSFGLEVDDVDFIVVADDIDAADSGRVTVCCLFGGIADAHRRDVLRQLIGRNLELKQQGSQAAFWLSDEDLIYVFSTRVSLEVVAELGSVMQAVARCARDWPQPH